MIRSIAAALAAFALVSFAAKAEDKVPAKAEPKAEAPKKAEKAAEKTEKAADKAEKAPAPEKK
jgi:hypothetical protein